MQLLMKLLSLDGIEAKMSVLKKEAFKLGSHHFEPLKLLKINGNKAQGE